MTKPESEQAAKPLDGASKESSTEKSPQATQSLSERAAREWLREKHAPRQGMGVAQHVILAHLAGQAHERERIKKGLVEMLARYQNIDGNIECIAASYLQGMVTAVSNVLAELLTKEGQE